MAVCPVSAGVLNRSTVHDHPGVKGLHRNTDGTGRKSRLSHRIARPGQGDVLLLSLLAITVYHYDNGLITLSFRLPYRLFGFGAQVQLAMRDPDLPKQPWHVAGTDRTPQQPVNQTRQGWKRFR